MLQKSLKERDPLVPSREYFSRQKIHLNRHRKAPRGSIYLLLLYTTVFWAVIGGLRIHNAEGMYKSLFPSLLPPLNGKCHHHGIPA